MLRIICPACSFEFEVSNDVSRGDVISCSNCGVDLEIVLIQDGVATVDDFLGDYWDNDEESDF